MYKKIVGDDVNLFGRKNNTIKPKIRRICIYPKDIQRITWKRERYCHDSIQKINDFYKNKIKQEKQ